MLSCAPRRLLENHLSLMTSVLGQSLIMMVHIYSLYWNIYVSQTERGRETVFWFPVNTQKPNSYLVNVAWLKSTANVKPTIRQRRRQKGRRKERKTLFKKSKERKKNINNSSSTSSNKDKKKKKKRRERLPTPQQQHEFKSHHPVTSHTLCVLQRHLLDCRPHPRYLDLMSHRGDQRVDAVGHVVRYEYAHQPVLLRFSRHVRPPYGSLRAAVPPVLRHPVGTRRSQPRSVHVQRSDVPRAADHLSLLLLRSHSRQVHICWIPVPVSYSTDTEGNPSTLVSPGAFSLSEPVWVTAFKLSHT